MRRRREITSTTHQNKTWQSATFRVRDHLHNLYYNKS